MVVLENGLLLDGVLYAVLDLIRRLFRFEVYQTAGVLPVFEDMNDGVGRPFALIAWVIAAGAACPLYSSVPGVGICCSVSIRAILVGPFPARQSW
jgi:hypothetical protein